jgi:hypothetical protein
MFNSLLQQWERLLEPGPGGPARLGLSLGQADLQQAADIAEETPLDTEGESWRQSLRPHLTGSPGVSIDTWGRNQDAEPGEKIQTFLDEHVFCPEAAPGEGSSQAEHPQTSGESGSEASVSDESGRGGAWAGQAAQAGTSLSAVVTCDQTVELNITSSLLVTLKGLLGGEAFQPAAARLANRLAVGGSLLLTEIQVGRLRKEVQSPQASAGTDDVNP